MRFSNAAQDRGVHDTYWGWGVEFTDADNDGDLDIVAVTGMDQFVYLGLSPSSPIYNTPGVRKIDSRKRPLIAPFPPRIWADYCRD